MAIIYRGYNIEEGKNFFNKTIYVVTNAKRELLFTGETEEQCQDWIDVLKKKTA